MKLFISKLLTLNSQFSIFLLCIVYCTVCNEISAQESRANANSNYNFQQGRLLFDQKQYAVSSQYFTKYLEQQNGKEVCELCQEAEYYIAINAYKLRDKNATDILEEYLEKYNINTIGDIAKMPKSFWTELFDYREELQ